MTVALTMIVRDEAPRLLRAVESTRQLVDDVFVVDTGSTDGTQQLAHDMGAHVVEIPWEGFADARTQALKVAGAADWVLMLDADQSIQHHLDLKGWLDADPEPSVDAFMVTVLEAGTSWRMPRLTRGGADLRYEGVTHEWLEGGTRMSLYENALRIHHHADGSSRPVKHQRDLELLDGLTDPRSVYYRAQALQCLGRTDEAAAEYDRRAKMTRTWEEERWHAQYMAARLRNDVAALLAAHAARPHRHEPLTWAARIVAGETHSDGLFCEDVGHV